MSTPPDLPGELATLADELFDPLHACRGILEMLEDGRIDGPWHIATALIALVDKAESKRERLAEALDRLAESQRFQSSNNEGVMP